MQDGEVARYWDESAEAWTLLARAGWDVYRDYVNTPAFLELLPDVRGLTGLDLGCGEGHNTRLLARRGASVCALDLSAKFIRYAREAEMRDPLGIRYVVASARHAPFPDAAFDFVTACMSLMDMPDPDAALCEAWRVLRPGGFLQFSITHPCFDTPHRRQLKDPVGRAIAMQVAGYFDGAPGRIDEWIFGAAPPEVRAGLRPFRIPRFHRPLADWLNAVVEAGFRIERAVEPCASSETAARCPKVADTRLVPYFFHARCRKPGGPLGISSQ